MCSNIFDDVIHLVQLILSVQNKVHRRGFEALSEFGKFL